MRNYYFPKHLADYIPLPELKQLKRSNAVIERDYQFGMQKEQEALDEGAEIKSVEMSEVTQPARGTGSGKKDGVWVELDQLDVCVYSSVPGFYRRMDEVRLTMFLSLLPRSRRSPKPFRRLSTSTAHP